MRKYECAIILAPTVSAEILERASKKYADVIASNGGKVIEVDDWGRRTLAYEIKFHREGYYRFYRFEGSNDTLDELNRQLRIDEDVIRHMIVADTGGDENDVVEEKIKGRDVKESEASAPPSEEA